jgi:large subunit ribosomal protein L31
VEDLKPNIHPKVEIIEVKCACGALYQVLSTRKEMRLDLCSACHPFFTGKRTIIDITGRVEKFERRAALAEKSTKTK